MINKGTRLNWFLKVVCIILNIFGWGLLVLLLDGETVKEVNRSKKKIKR